jgi:hypothetical protein
MKDKKLTQRMWDVLTQWIGDTIVVDEYRVSIRRGSRNSTVIWVSIDFRGSHYAQIGLESKDIGTTRIPIEIADLLRKAFELKVNGGIYLSNPCAEIPLMSTTTEADVKTNSSGINGYHYDDHFIPPDDAIAPTGPW